ncbi:MAG TPA: phosphate ABC transporter permease PstA [Pseudoclavibacter sp.]|nr:phosphate ABC transporter permease PstA [Pseudoclavibacter sp.]
MTAPAPSSSLTAGRLPKSTPWIILAACVAVAGFGIGTLSGNAVPFNLVGGLLVGMLIYMLVIYITSRRVEGQRKATDRVVTALVSFAFLIALTPLISVAWTAVSNGMARFDVAFFTQSMRNITGEGGGALHAIIGTLLITLAATIISVPIGLLTAIYLVEYGRGKFAQAITFLVDVMTGIPSIVAGLFAYGLFSLIFGAWIRFGIGGAVALSVLMIPVVVRSSEEMLKLVPNELREAAFALGVPKWRTITKVVLPTSAAGIATGITLAISRIIGETAPLLIIAGYTSSMNYNLFLNTAGSANPMMTLPVFVYSSYANPGSDVQPYLDRAWAGALTLILIVMLLNLIARLIAKYFAPKTSGR